MKKILATGTLAVFVLATMAQTTSSKKTVPAAPKTGFQLKTLEDSVNYAMGLSVAGFYKQQGIKKVNIPIVTRAMNDALAGKPQLLSDAQANSCMMTYFNQQQMIKAKPNIEEGQKFLATNKTRQGVTTTASGLQYEVLQAGTGSKPKATDTVTVNYRGTLLDGSVFDDSYARGQSATFPLNRVIPGWTEGVQLMAVGSKYKFYIPYQLGYGVTGSEPTIPGGAVLIFEVELLGINGK